MCQTANTRKSNSSLGEEGGAGRRVQDLGAPRVPEEGVRLEDGRRHEGHVQAAHGGQQGGDRLLPHHRDGLQVRRELRRQEGVLRVQACRGLDNVCYRYVDRFYR